MLPHNAQGVLTNHFQTQQPLFRLVAQLNSIRAAHPALRAGAQKVLGDDSAGPGLFVFERHAGKDIVLVVANTARESREFTLKTSALPAGARLEPALEPGKPLRINPSGEVTPMLIPAQSAEIWTGRAD
jgi:glycosidase